MEIKDYKTKLRALIYIPSYALRGRPRRLSLPLSSITPKASEASVDFEGVVKANDFPAQSEEVRRFVLMV